MARLRTLKPGFFVNDELAALGPYAMLLFEGLWCHSDREGRLRDRPLRLKVEILPYFDVDADELLTALERACFIIRYDIDGVRYIQVINFRVHQSPHHKEAASIIPPPPGYVPPAPDPELEEMAEEPAPESPVLAPTRPVASRSVVGSGFMGSGNQEGTTLAKASAPPPAARVRVAPRPRAEPDESVHHEAFNALSEVFGAPASERERGIYAKAAKDLVMSKPPAFADEIPKLRDAWAELYNGASPSPPALVANLGRLRHHIQSPRAPPSNGRAPTRAAIREHNAVGAVAAIVKLAQSRGEIPPTLEGES
jgi:hypothetical protein